MTNCTCIEGKFGKSPISCQVNTIQISAYSSILLADLFILQTSFHQILEKSQFAKLSSCQSSHYTIFCIPYDCKESGL